MKNARSIASRRAALLLAFVAYLTAHASTALADEAAQARLHDELAREHYRARRYEAAVREFLLEQRLAPNPRIVFNIALCFDQLDRPNQAFFYFTEYLRAADLDPERRALATRALERLHPKVARIRVDTTPPGAAVFVDQREHGSYGTTPVTIPTGGGTHHLWINLPGYRPAELDVTAALGQEIATTVTLDRIEGRLIVESSTRAEVLVLDPNGTTITRGQAPLTAALPPDVYVIAVSAIGFRARRDIVRIEADRRLVHAAPLEALPPPTGELIVTSNVLGAVVEIDGEPFGFAPATISELTGGTHGVAVRHPGLVPWSGTVEVRAEQKAWLTATLEPEPRLRRSTATWIAGSLGLAALAASIPVAVLAGNKHAEFERRLAAEDGTDLHSLRDEGQAFAATADALWIGGALATAAGVLLYFATEEVESRPSSATVSWDQP